MGIRDGRPGEAPVTSHFKELAVDECWRLAASRPLGRIGYTGRHGPQVLPVNHAVRERSIVFRCAAYSDLANDVHDILVAFEVDEVDDATCTGWSVLVVGLASVVDDPDELVELWSGGGAHPWAPGTRAGYVRITPRQITGRSISSA